MTDQEKIDKLASIADRAIFWLFHAALFAEYAGDKEDVALFESKAKELQDKLEELKNEQ